MNLLTICLIFEYLTIITISQLIPFKLHKHSKTYICILNGVYTQFFFDIEVNFTYYNLNFGKIPLKVIISNEQTQINLKKRVLFLDGKAEGILNFIKPRIQFDKFNFYYSSKYNGLISKLGLGYNFSEIKASIVYWAYMKNLIKSPQFGLYYSFNEEDTLYIYLGGLPKKVIRNRLSFSINVTNSTGTLWSINIDYILFNGEKFLTDKPIRISNVAIASSLLIPNEFMNFLERNFFVKFKDYCIQLLYDIQCTCKVLVHFPPIIIISNNNKFVLEQTDLFSRLNDGWNCNFLMKTKKEDWKDVWVFGETFMKKYLPIFNYETNSITFYYESNSIIYNLFNINIVQMLLASCILLLFFKCHKCKK